MPHTLVPAKPAPEATERVVTTKNPKHEPDRSAWMSDAGYKSSLSAQAAAPSIARMADCTVSLKCPHCRTMAKVAFTAETAPSDGYVSEQVCDACGKEFVVDAVLDVKVRAN